MYLYRVTHPRNVSVVIPKSALASAPRVHLNVPDVTVSSQRLLSPDEARRQADQARVNQDLAGFGGDDQSAPIEDLTSMGPRAVPGLTAALSARDSDTRKNAAAVLDYFAQQDSDGSQGYRQAFSDSNTLDALSHLSDDEDSETRRVVAETLGNMGDRSALSTLDQLATDDDSDVRMAVVTSLGKLNDSDSINTLATLLDDDESAIRQGAADALGKFASIKEAHDALVDRLPKEYDEDVKRTILNALGLPNIDERDL